MSSAQNIIAVSPTAARSALLSAVGAIIGSLNFSCRQSDRALLFLRFPSARRQAPRLILSRRRDDAKRRADRRAVRSNRALKTGKPCHFLGQYLGWLMR